MQLPKEIWIKADWDEPWEKRKEFVVSGLESGADGAIVRAEDVKKTRKLGNIKTISNSEKSDILLLEARNTQEIEAATVKSEEEGKEVALSVNISSKELEEAAVKAGKSIDYLIAIAQDWKVIPLENMIAELQDSKSRILAGVKDAKEAKTAIETLEVGADGVVLDPREKGLDEINKTCEALEEAGSKKFELVPAKITKIEEAGMGDRACVDTSSLMKIGEGMLVGSQSDGMFLVHSESLESEYVAARPFRVNAGAVHAYIQVSEERTKYLSELESGDGVLIVNSKGVAKKATVGRVKIERRPMLLVEVEHEGSRIKTLLQNAETINLVKKDGEPVSISVLEPGDEVLIHIQKGGRHFGAQVEETLVEK